MTKNDDIRERILNIVKSSSPATVESLVDQAQQELNLPRDKILEAVIQLENDGRLHLTRPPEPTPADLTAYAKSSGAAWFWISVALSAATAISVFTVPEDSYPLVYARYILGSLFVLFLPGFSLIKTLFPTKEIDNIERTALSIGMSLALVPLVGLLLNYTPWGIRVTPITLSLLALTLILSTTGLIREYQKKTGQAE